MNTCFLAIFNGWEVLMIFLVVVLLFGPKKLPDLAKGLGEGIKEFKKASRESDDDHIKPTPPPAQKTAQAPHPESDHKQS